MSTLKTQTNYFKIQINKFYFQYQQVQITKSWITKVHDELNGFHSQGSQPVTTPNRKMEESPPKEASVSKKFHQQPVLYLISQQSTRRMERAESGRNTHIRTEAILGSSFTNSQKCN